MRSFFDGEIVTSLKRAISAKEAQSVRLGQQKTFQPASKEEIVRISSSYEFTYRVAMTL